MKLELSRFEAALFLIGLGALALGSTLDWALLHPGYAAYDEASFVALLQVWREGGGLQAALGGGSLHRGLAALFSAVFGPSWAALHAAGLFWLLTESLLLLAWGARLGQARSGLWAALINLGSAQTWVRSRALLSFCAVPAQLLLALWVLPRRGAGPWRAALIGAALSLLSLDYELWFWGLPLLALAWLQFWRPTAAEAAAGFAAGALGLALCAGLSGFDLTAYWQVRQNRSLALQRGWADWTRGLSSLVIPARHPLHFLGADGAAWAPLWVWAAALLALWHAGRKALVPALFLAAALAPALSYHAEREPQRLLLAWPMLCGAAAWGLGSLPVSKRYGGLLGALLLLAVWPAWTVFQGSQDRHALLPYGAAAQQDAALRSLRKQGGPAPRILSDLSLDGGPALRFALDAARIQQDPQGPLLVLAPWDFFPQGWDPAWGSWQAVPGDARLPGYAWLSPRPARRERLLADAALMQGFESQRWKQRGSRHGLALAEAYLDRDPGPWARTLLALAWLKAAIELESLPEPRFSALLAGPLLGAAFHEDAMLYLQQQGHPGALAMAEEACRRDPRRSAPWEQRIRLLRAQGREAEAAKVEAAYRALRP